MTLMSSATRNDGRSSGNVIERYVRHGDAPSTRAASYSSAGIVWQAGQQRVGRERQRHEDRDHHHPDERRNPAGRAQSAWLLPKCLTTPMSCRKTLTTPYCGSSAQAEE